MPAITPRQTEETRPNARSWTTEKTIAVCLIPALFILIVAIINRMRWHLRRKRDARLRASRKAHSSKGKSEPALPPYDDRDTPMTFFSSPMYRETAREDEAASTTAPRPPPPAHFHRAPSYRTLGYGDYGWLSAPGGEDLPPYQERESGATWGRSGCERGMNRA